MSEKYTQTLAELAQQLVTPERYGKVVLAEVVELYPDLPETNVVYLNHMGD